MWKFALMNAKDEEIFIHQEATRDKLESWLVGFGANAPAEAVEYQILERGHIVERGAWPQPPLTMQITNVETHRTRERREVNKKVRVFIILEGENMLENFGNRTSRPWKAWKPLVEEKLREMEIPFEKVRWDRHAGCSMCPCSPGFVVDGPRRGELVWMTIDGSVKATDPEESAWRQNQLLRQF